MQSPPFPRYLFPPRSKYSPQHHILKRPQLPFLPQCQRPGFTPMQNNRQIYSQLLILKGKYFIAHIYHDRFDSWHTTLSSPSEQNCRTWSVLCSVTLWRHNCISVIWVDPARQRDNISLNTAALSHLTHMRSNIDWMASALRLKPVISISWLIALKY